MHEYTGSVPSRRILGMRVDATSYQHATEQVLHWGRLRESRYVCVATVNNVIEAYDDRAYHEVMDGADIVTPDGMPLVWALRLLGWAERSVSMARTSRRSCASAPPRSASRSDSTAVRRRSSQT